MLHYYYYYYYCYYYYYFPQSTQLYGWFSHHRERSIGHLFRRKEYPFGAVYMFARLSSRPFDYGHSWLDSSLAFSVQNVPDLEQSQIICYSSCLSVVINEEFNQLFFRIYLSRSDAGCHVGPSLAPPVLPRNSAISGRLYLPWSDNVAYFDKSESFSSANEYNY